MYKVLMGGLIIAAMATGCQGGAACSSEVKSKFYPNERTVTVCMDEGKTVTYTNYRHGERTIKRVDYANGNSVTHTYTKD